MTRTPIWPLLVLVSACSLGPDVPGSADVMGHVTDHIGAPLVATSVVIRCGTAVAPVQTTTDSAGWYGLQLASTVPGEYLCSFGVPDLESPRIHVDRRIFFVARGDLHPLQIVHLQEGASP